MVVRPKSVVFVGQFPPPVNGLTFITSQLADALQRAGYNIVTKSTTGRAGKRGIAFHASRILKTFAALIALVVKARPGEESIGYVAAEGGLGLIYTLTIVSVARPLRYRLFIHHHSFSYIIRRRPLMKWVLSMAGPEAVHICLCSEMAQELSNTYNVALRSIVLSNAPFVFVEASKKTVRPDEAIVIGLLSNLTVDKGLYVFLEILRLAKLRDLPIRGVLAGPIAHTADMMFTKSLQDELAGFLEYRGPVYGDRKTRLFQDIDVFVFPTFNDAQPTVIFEALAHGVPVISCDRGCIGVQVGGAGFVLPQDGGDAVSNILALLDQYRQEPSLLQSQRAAACRQFDAERLAGEALVKRLFETKSIEVAPPA